MAITRKERNELVVEPTQKLGLLDVVLRLKPVKDEFPDTDRGLGELDEMDLSQSDRALHPAERPRV